MGRASRAKRERRATGASGRPGRHGFPANPWAQSSGVDEQNPTAVLHACQERLAGLHAMRQAIHHDDRQLYAAAAAVHDHHARHADQLEAEIHRVGVGEDPLLEDAHMHHLEHRKVAEEVAHTLKKRIDAFDPD